MIKASIIVPTYNHAPFIRQCLDSLVMQETNFPYEILVGEDESSDGTREICIEYAQKYPEKIRLFLNKRADVVYIHGYPTGRHNFLHLLKQARGEYLAFCDGDDYWNSTQKLQKQVEFLESNPDYGIVHTGAVLLYEKTKKSVANLHAHLGLTIPEGKVYEKLLQRSFIVTATMMVRKKFVDQLLEWEIFDPYRYMMLDYPIKLYAAYYSKVKFFPEEMATHRILSESASNSKNVLKMLHFYQSQYELVNFFCEVFGCSPQTRQNINRRYYRMFIKRLAVLGKTREAREYFSKLKELEGSFFRLNWNDIAYFLFIMPVFNTVFRNVYLPILKSRSKTF